MKELNYFVESEFEDNAGEGWWDRLSPKLGGMLDQLRHQTGKTILIKKTIGAIGRINGPTDGSSHNVENNDFEELRAVDVSVFNKDGSRLDETEARVFVSKARDAGFTGIGVYPFWTSPGFHLDCRWSHPAGNPATWADVGVYPKHDYTGMEKGFEAWSK